MTVAEEKGRGTWKPSVVLSVAFLLATAIGLLLFTYRYLGAVAESEPKPFTEPLITEMTAAYSAGLLFFAVRFVARRFRLDVETWYRSAPFHLVALAAFGGTLTSMMWVSRSLLFPVFGLGPYHYGKMPHRYFMEFPIQIITYTFMVTGVYIADYYRRAQERELRAAHLEAQLSRAELHNLQLRLQPHFLFNALNTISSTMYDDPAAADEMASHLADLLRLSLRTDQSHEVPLATELEALGHYLSLIHARFGDRLRVTLEVEASTERLLVPALVLQPLVENAVHHGSASRNGTGHIAVSARRQGDRLRLEVRDDGPGAPSSSGEGSGLGLSLTRERLRLLYGDRASFSAGTLPEGGFLVALAWPARSGDA